MTEADVDRIETALGVKLPAAYRHLLTHFPIRFEQGTSVGPLWDHADALIKRNQELRAARRSLGTVSDPIPPHYVFIGDDGGGWQHLLDIRIDPPIVSLMEFEDVATISPHKDDQGKPQALNDWVHQYLIELKNDGVDVAATSNPNEKFGWGCVLGGLGFCLVAAVVIALMVFGLQSIFGG
jgi:hypothetical protein